MSQVIFLNGCGSSGKTSIIKGFQSLSEHLWIAFGVDTFIDMLPYTKEEKYFKLVPDSNRHRPTVRVETTKLGHDFFGICPDFAKLIADRGHNLIIDEVLFEDDLLKKYAEALKDHTVYYVGIVCDLKTLQERERVRKDRSIGLANDQFERVHQGLRANYDLRIDSTKHSPIELAQSLLAYIKKNSAPKIFKNNKNRSMKWKT